VQKKTIGESKIRHRSVRPAVFMMSFYLINPERILTFVIDEYNEV